MNCRSKRHAPEGHGITRRGWSVVPGLHRCSHLKAYRTENIGLFSIGILDKRDATSAVRIILHRSNAGLYLALTPLEVNQTVFALVTSTNVAACDLALVISTSAPGKGLGQVLFGLLLGDLLVGWPHLVAVRGSHWLEAFKWHDWKLVKSINRELVNPER